MQFAMSQFDSNKDYYGVLGVDKEASRIDIERQYKRKRRSTTRTAAASEERMKSLNEAYRVLKNESLRNSYDETQRRPARHTLLRSRLRPRATSEYSVTA
jgi:DnaJ-class molecular chaperone